MIKWSDKFEIGIRDIDEQHKRFFEIAEEIYYLSKNSLKIDKYDTIVDLIEELKNYTKYHFEYEEDFLQKIHYKKLFTHKMTHMKFIDEIENISMSNIDIDQDEEIERILNFVLKWILNHISSDDINYSIWYKENY